MTHNGTDDASRESVCVALATGDTVINAARKGGVSRETVHRWMRDPEFRARVSAAATALGEFVQERIKGMAQDAADVLADIMVDKDAEKRDRIAAARIILDRVAPTTQKHEVKDTTALPMADIEERILQSAAEIQARREKGK